MKVATTNLSPRILEFKLPAFRVGISSSFEAQDFFGLAFCDWHIKQIMVFFDPVNLEALRETQRLFPPINNGYIAGQTYSMPGYRGPYFYSNSLVSLLTRSQIDRKSVV